MAVPGWLFILISAMDALIKRILKKASRELSLDYSLVCSVYDSYWRYFRSVVSADSLSELSEDEFDGASRNVNVAYLGKVYTDYKFINGYRNKQKYLKDNVSTKKDKTDVQSGSGD